MKMLKLIEEIEEKWDAKETEALNESRAQQERIRSRIQRIKMMRKAGKTFVEIAEVLGIHVNTAQDYARRP